MPKVKSNSGAKKRFRVTKNGKVVRAKGYKRHLLEAKAETKTQAPGDRAHQRGRDKARQEDAAL